MAGGSFHLDPQSVPFVETQFRTIKTAIPCPGTKESLLRLERVESRSMQGQMPIVWDRAVDFNVWDKAGNKWIDFTSTIFVTNIGHANSHLKKSLSNVLDHDLLHTYAFAHETRIQYLESLIRFAGKPFEKAFLLSAGTEATEAALKLMRLNGQKKNKKRPVVICIEGNWHGRTMGAQMMSSNESQKAWIGYRDPNIVHIPFPYPWNVSEAQAEGFLKDSLKALESSGLNFATDVCGVMLETFQGWGAVFYPQNFVKAMRDFCDQNGILLCFDEMQAGFARTGMKFGYHHYGVEADLICCGKGMSSGLPLSGVLGRAEVMDLPEVGNMSSTHSANPLCCAAGLATLEEIEGKNLVSESKSKGAEFHAWLNALTKKFPNHVKYISGRGMIAAVIFENGSFASSVSELAMQKGLLVVHTGRESIKLAPPLSIPLEALKEGVQVLEQCISEAIQGA